MVPRAPMSIRWSGDFVCPATGRYLFSVTSDDGCRLKINGRTILDKWEVRAATTDYTSTGMQQGQTYHIEFEYFDNGGDAVAHLKWRMPATVSTDPLDAYGNAGKRIRESDLTIAVMGINQNDEREGLDRSAIELPEEQTRFLRLAYEANPRLVVVFVAGSPLADEWLSANAPAILYAWYPGEQGGTAVADALLGDYNPGGRLPITYYRSTDVLPAFDDYDVTNNRTYMYHQQEPLYPFGHGLSYTTFGYSGLQLKQQSDTLWVDFDVTNTGSVDGDEVPQVYVRYPSLPRPLPIKQLQGFERVHVLAGATAHLSIPIALADLRLWDTEQAAFYTPEGDYAVMVGASSADIRLQQMWRVGSSSGDIITSLPGVTVVTRGDQLTVSTMSHPVDARVYCPDGRLVTTMAHIEGMRSQSLPQGIYLVVVTDNQSTRTFKVLIQ